MQDFDYMDEDVAYLLGLLVARGELLDDGSTYKVIIRFPKGKLGPKGENEKEIKLGMESIRERILNLLAGDIKTSEEQTTWDLIATLTRKTIGWRDLNMLLEGKKNYQYFQVPKIILDPSTPTSVKAEFIKGYADVNGSIRRSNNDQAGLHRARLETMNERSTWGVPVTICHLLQAQLGVPVQTLQWGHPNVGHAWREHQLNVYAHHFTKVGFYLEFKQKLLEELAEENIGDKKTESTSIKYGCPGPFHDNKGNPRKPYKNKPIDPLENDAQKLNDTLIGQHFDGYFQLCQALGCDFARSPQNV